MLARKFLVKTMDFLVLALEFFNNAVTLPGNFQAELQLSGHLLEDVFERRIDTLEHLADVFVGAEHGAETHGDDGVILHHRFDHVLMRQSVVAGRIKDEYGSAADHGRNVAIVDGVNVFIHAANATVNEGRRGPGLDHSIYIASL